MNKNTRTIFCLVIMLVLSLGVTGCKKASGRNVKGIETTETVTVVIETEVTATEMIETVEQDNITNSSSENSTESTGAVVIEENGEIWVSSDTNINNKNDVITADREIPSNTEDTKDDNVEVPPSVEDNFDSEKTNQYITEDENATPWG